MKLHVNINEILHQLLLQEDTDGDKRITIEDKGPKEFSIVSNGEKIVVQGTYALSNLLQELILAKERGHDFIESEKIFELPSNRLSRVIKDYFWDGLTRTMDEEGLQNILIDVKSKSGTPIVYVPFTDTVAFDFYSQLEQKYKFQVVQLPEKITPEYVSGINDFGGVLSLKLEEKSGKLVGKPFVVPGGRFNEMYGWDSYFENIGLLIDGKIELAKSMVENFAYQIQHYGKILNANRSYYLTRTQPPFFSSMLIEVFEAMPVKDLEWLKENILVAIHEYESVWMQVNKRWTSNGLNRYLAEGIGLPPETEEGHYDDILKPYAAALQMTIPEYERGYYQRKIQNPALDAYFVHDRSVRESGHDTSYRLEGICASLNAVELNAMLYKYETDFAHIIASYFEDELEYNTKIYNCQYWLEKASSRKELMNQLLWNEELHCYFDYNIETNSQHLFLSATSFFPLWAKIASPEQAQQMIEKELPKLIFNGGVAGCSAEALAQIADDQMKRQWDFPNGWAPHQMIIWQGLENYGYHDLTQELVYRWLWMITKNACDYNGTVPEKYNVEIATHKVFAEYGNQGTDFEYITREGFGWMNASFQLGMQLLKEDLKQQLNQLVHPENLFYRKK